VTSALLLHGTTGGPGKPADAWAAAGAARAAVPASSSAAAYAVDLTDARIDNSPAVH
jgi:hypothetical protein